jgi:hypothetical protein
MATVLGAKRLTTEEISEDLSILLKEEFKMTLPEFMSAVEQGKLPRTNSLVREVLSWARLLVPANNEALCKI